MTLSGDFIPAEDDLYDEPTNPVVFGLELTPRVLGILAALAGIGLAIFLFQRFVQPVRQSNQELRESIAEKEQQLATQEQRLEEIADLEEARDAALVQRRNVYSLFADESSMDTLLLDINQRIKNSNASIAASRNQIIARGIPPILVEAQLRSFVPSEETVIEDGSLGTEVDGKLKRQTYSVEFSGDFAQTQSILSNIERLEPLLLLREFSLSAADTVNETVLNAQGQVVPQPKERINSSFQVDALIPTGDPNAPPEIVQPSAPEDEDAEDG
ncbi:type iv pilus assembly protein [Leptolyngbya sp. Heron Island J]|uniref:type II secretion system protein M n=1 Tax=Leptolyngbya sp. Heron Island J TaxID=1385935 RepID=UPI0003B9ADD6|nr:type II secretion system protein M [Leptolyngbya sp. Heron Island J]ESA34364.1 type iv pilus assembly protein [Leptolyngbya sp. Heron Island J]